MPRFGFRGSTASKDAGGEVAQRQATKERRALGDISNKFTDNANRTKKPKLQQKHLVSFPLSLCSDSRAIAHKRKNTHARTHACA